MVPNDPFSPRIIPETRPPDPTDVQPFDDDGHAPRPPAAPGYQIAEELGRGGMGVIYRAIQPGLNRTVALKMILAGGHASPQDSARFRAEAEAIARLQHPNIVQIHEIGQIDGLPFIALEFCAGGSLARRLAAGPPPPAQAASLIEALARAMDAAHRSSIVHRDLKPANILFAADGTPKVTDFGLVKRLDAAGVTASGTIMGTPSYMAPEQARGDVRAIGPAADIYALGAILYECLTGRPPFVGDSVHEMITQVIESEPLPPSRLGARLPRDLVTICLKCLQKDPARRYATAADLADDLRHFALGEPIRARPVGRIEHAWRRARRHPALAVLGLAVASLSLVILTLARRGEPPAAPETRGEEVREVVAELDRAEAGWRLEQLEEQRAVVPPERNSATRIAAAVRLLPEGWMDRFERARLLDKKVWPAGSPLTSSQRSFLDDWLKGTDPARVDARSLAGFPEGRSPINYRRDGISILLTHAQNARYIIGLLSFDALRLANEGDFGSGIACCRAEINAGRSLRDEPIVSSQLVRMSSVTGSVWDSNWILGQGIAPEASLGELQRYYEQEAGEPVLLIMARSGRGMDHWMMSAISSGDMNPARVIAEIGGDDPLIEALKAMPTDQDVRKAHAWMLQHWTRLVAIAKLPDHRQVAAAREWDRITGMAPDGVRPLVVKARPLVEACLRHRALTRCAAVALAVERHRLRSGRWPSTLAELGPDLLAEIPADPYDGATLRYRHLADGVVVYALGPDGQDNGGSYDLAQPGKGEPGTDFGFRLWDASKRGRGTAATP